MEKERMATKTDNGGIAFCIIKLEPTRRSLSLVSSLQEKRKWETRSAVAVRGRNLEGVITTVRPVHLRDWRSFFTRLWWFLIQVRSWPAFPVWTAAQTLLFRNWGLDVRQTKDAKSIILGPQCTVGASVRRESGAKLKRILPRGGHAAVFVALYNWSWSWAPFYSFACNL